MSQTTAPRRSAAAVRTNAAFSARVLVGNRTYGLNIEAGETMQPQPFSLVGDGAGSVFKVFTVAAAMDMGMGINAQLDAPGPI